MDELQQATRLFLSLLRVAPAGLGYTCIAGALCEAFLILVSFAVKGTAGDDPALEPTVTGILKAILYAEFIVGILTVLFMVALMVVYLLNRVGGSSGSGPP